MRRLLPILIISGVIFWSAGESNALPPCATDTDSHRDNCFGAHTYADGGRTSVNGGMISGTGGEPLSMPMDV